MKGSLRIKKKVSQQCLIDRLFTFQSAEFTEMVTKKFNMQKFNILEPTKSKRNLRHKKHFPDFVTDIEKENEKQEVCFLIPSYFFKYINLLQVKFIGNIIIQY